MFVDPSGYELEGVMVANAGFAILDSAIMSFATAILGLVKSILIPVVAAVITVVILLPIIYYFATYGLTENYSESVRDSVIEDATGNASASEATSAGGSGTATPPPPNDPDNRNNKDVKKVDEKYLERELKKDGTNPHQFKAEYLKDNRISEPVSHFNVYRNSKTGELIIMHNKGLLPPIQTGFFI
jgi:hypothetical protein